MNEISTTQKKFSNVEDIIDLQMAGKVEEAHDAYVAYFTEHDVNSEAFTLFGLCCVTLGKIEKARKIFEHIISLQPDFALPYFHLTVLMVKHDDAEKVFGLIDAAIIQTADKSNVYSHAAKICIEKEDFRQADAFWSEPLI